MSDWLPISALDKSKMQFVLVYQDGAQRTMLWNPNGYWEHPHPFPFGAVASEYESGGNPTHWMELPDNPE